MLHLLKKYFGYEQFRPMQEEIVNQCMAGADALVLMPTGGGKSLCYQLPALGLPGLALVVSPLIALMKDQVDTLRANGVPAAFINSTLSPEDIREIEYQALEGGFKLLYLAPERIAMAETQRFLQKLKVSLFAIDEAHCISEWGHDFRPDYRSLRILRQMFPRVPIMALTATANARVRDDILSQLDIARNRVFQSSFNRPNLTYRVLPKKRAFDSLLQEIRSRPNQAIIVYCFSRKSTEKTMADLRANGVNAAAYHAGLNADERTRVQEAFIRDQISVIVATVAFGMGIDKPDVRLVVHMDLPKSVEGYYQETGRAGRDGLPSECLLFYSAGDRFKHEFFIREMRDPNEQLRARRQLAAIASYAELETCRRSYLLNYFSEAWNATNCGACDICAPRPIASYLAPTRMRETDYDQELFEQLRTLRRTIAETQRIPPYVVFGDKSLHEMCRLYPQKMEEMAQVFGVGREKLVRYGARFLEVITRYAQTKGIESNTRPAVRVEPIRRALTQTISTTIEMFNNGKTVEQISTERQLVQTTVFNHLEQAFEQGTLLSLSSFPAFDPVRYGRIAEAFQNSENDMLAPIRARLGETFSYEEIRLVRLHLRIQKQTN